MNSAAFTPVARVVPYPSAAVAFGANLLRYNGFAASLRLAMKESYRAR